MSTFCFFLGTVCQNPLGLENHDIEDYQMTSSNMAVSTTDFLAPWNARLNSKNFPSTYKNGLEQGYFFFKSVPGDWLQVDLLVPHEITAIALQGRPTVNNYVKTFKICYSFNDVDTCNWYSDNLGNVVVRYFLIYEILLFHFANLHLTKLNS